MKQRKEEGGPFMGWNVAGQQGFGKREILKGWGEGRGWEERRNNTKERVAEEKR